MARVLFHLVDVTADEAHPIPDTVGLPLEPGKTYVDIDTVSAWGLFSPLAAVAAFSDRAMRSPRPGGGSG